MQEIGGYFGLEKLKSNEYHKGLIAINTGRNALLYLLKARQIKKLYIPYYLCDSVSDMCSQYRYAFECYHINEGFMPVFDRELAEGEYLYIVNYYGQLTDKQILDLRQKFRNIILDNTQAFFQRPLAGVDTLYSCRKFFGVPDGAYLSTDIKLSEELEVDISKDRMIHILGRYEGKASDYYSYFRENDALLKSQPLKYMSRLTHNILGAIDYNEARCIRNENYVYLERELQEVNKLRLVTPEGPFAYPFYMENGMEIKRMLAEKKIYIPTLWPNVLQDSLKGSLEYDYAANILPLPCDQRYGMEEMGYMIGELKSCVAN